MSLSTQDINELTDSVVQGIYGVLPEVPLNVNANSHDVYDKWKEDHERLRSAIFNLIVALDRR